MSYSIASRLRCSTSICVTATVATSPAAIGEGSDMGPMRIAPPPTNRVKEVTFKVSRPDGQYGLHKLADTTFALGLGPCGRWVQRLEVEVTDHLLRIRQHSTEFDITEVAAENSESERMIAYHQGRYPWLKKELSADLLEFHKERFNTTKALLRKANEGYEIKEFIYKIADIHGRIVTTK
ncbi:hypothetical protein phiPSA2_06 [Pseudomonas phage phiPSA2]|uniref:Uncharacterized protein n=1 Tax=Pseudomonas phage phiPSA2 TaxID=1500756 RepID=A0A059VFS9_9CAUD|nr:hypothetical protein HL07_gp06 [Pseudomonas phage phiPSA2]AHZ94987.1 hypothetical protein phiPSA2_06 [Pseudomonas phage phiPSA2]